MSIWSRIDLRWTKTGSESYRKITYRIALDKFTLINQEIAFWLNRLAPTSQEKWKNKNEIFYVFYFPWKTVSNRMRWITIIDAGKWAPGKIKRREYIPLGFQPPTTNLYKGLYPLKISMRVVAKSSNSHKLIRGVKRTQLGLWVCWLFRGLDT